MKTSITTKRETDSSVEARNEELKKLKRELFLLMLKKAKLKEDDIIDMLTSLWISQHLDMLTEEELKPYKKYLLL